jgi:conserved oligomeric Golgi complex subunit 5
MSDYAAFADPNFNAHDYVRSILAKSNEQLGSYTTDLDLAKEDIAISISKLDHGIEDVGKQLKHVVFEHHEALLQKAASVSDLEVSIKSVRKGLDELNFSVDK